MTTTIFLASRDSSVQSRRKADYLCEGDSGQYQLQAAIDALPTYGGKIVLAEGTFVTAPFVANKSFVLQGQGMSAGSIRDFQSEGITTLKLADASNDTLFKKAPLNDNTPNTHWHVGFKDLCINGNKGNQSPGDHHGLQLDFLESYLENVRVWNCGGNGFHAGADYTRNQINMVNCQGVGNAGFGAYLLAQGCHLKGTNYFGGNLHGLFIGGSSGDTWIEAQCEANRGYGFWASQIGTSYLNIWTAGNHEDGVLLNNVCKCYGYLFGKDNSILPVLGYISEIHLEGVRECDFALIAGIYRANHRGIAFSYPNTKNNLRVQVSPNETMPPADKATTVGLEITRNGGMVLDGTTVTGFVHAGTPIFYDGTTQGEVHADGALFNQQSLVSLPA